MDSFSSQGSSTTAIESKSYTYAELLLNIRQVTVSLSLDPPSHKSTKLCLSSDRQGLELSHDGHEYTIRLPAKVIHPQRSANQSLLLAIPSSPSKEFSVRLPLDGDAHPRASAPHHTENEMPWTAAKLPVPVQLQCCHCANVLTQYGAIRAWKDLPSDSWAEMMDFWHCHKPAEHTNAKNHDTSEMDKGYAASNKLIARSGVGFVDLCYFLFYAADVTGVNVRKMLYHFAISMPSETTLCGCHFLRRFLSSLQPTPKGNKKAT